MSLVLRLFSMWLDQTSIDFDGKRCIVKRNKHVQCTKCIDACPIPNTISFENDSIIFNPQKCSECKSCTITCPNSVFQDKQLYKNLEKVKNKKSIVFACSKNQEENNYIEYTCLRQLTLSHLLYAGIYGSDIGLLYNYESCKKCAFFSSGLEPYIKKIANTANQFFESSANFSFVSISNEFNLDEPIYSRSEFLNYVPKTIKSGSRDFLPDWKESVSVKDKLNKSNESIILDYTLNKFSEKRDLNMDMDIDLRLVGVAKVKITENCNGCGICVAHCPSQSLIIEKNKELLRISQNLLNCMDCTACQKTCPNEAVEFEYTSKVKELLHSVDIFKKNMRVCKECGQPSDNELCYNCQRKKRLEEDVFQFFA